MKSVLRLYHIVFYPDPNTMYLNCYNIEAKSMEMALKIHYKKFPGIEPLYCVHKGETQISSSTNWNTNSSPNY